MCFELAQFQAYLVVRFPYIYAERDTPYPLRSQGRAAFPATDSSHPPTHPG